ncbi:MAG: DUF1937 family protein [Desulfovibrio sp.]|nr:DUF1937 family protein [Desulfovibrio sp.]
MRKIYLACPYTGTFQQRSSRVVAANTCAAALMRNGNVVFSPITHGHSIAEQCGLPHDWEWWMAQCIPFLEWADVMVVVTADGWKESRGVRAEIELAKEMGKPVEYMA